MDILTMPSAIFLYSFCLLQNLKVLKAVIVDKSCFEVCVFSHDNVYYKLSMRLSF